MPKTQNSDIVGKKAKAVVNPKPEIGIDTDNTFVDNIIEAGTSKTLDIAAIEAFTNVAQTRESIYSLIDTMSRDCILSSIIQSYVEDSVETNEKGQIVWAESSDGDVAKYVSWLLETLNVDKYIYSWCYCLVKYGDVYLKLYRKSDYDFDPVFNVNVSDVKQKDVLNENVQLVTNTTSDHYVHFVELVKNPGEMFELTRLGKTMGYIQAPINVQTVGDNESNLALSFMRYQLKRDDVKVYGAGDFVHACLEDNSSRTDEEVDIFLDNDTEDKTKSINYSVKRGQSILSNIFKIWRELSLLENSVLLNRLTKSSIVRTIQVEVGQMPKDKIPAHLQKLKSLIEQKSAINTDNGMSEYTNPGPVENNIYIPTHDGKGAITVGQIGGDVDVKSLVDLDWFNNRLFGSLGIPKQFFGFTDDGAGFNGGTSLTILSSKYGKAVKRIQNTLCQLITDLINLLLIDKGLTNYVNKFIIRMQATVTQEEKDRRENNDNRIRYISDLMSQFSDIQEPQSRLKILKSLLTPIINDPEVIKILEQEIAKLEESKAPKAEPTDNPDMDTDLNINIEGPELGGGAEETLPLEMPTEEPTPELSTETPQEADQSYLPSFAELGVPDGTDSSQF